MSNVAPVRALRRALLVLAVLTSTLAGAPVARAIDLPPGFDVELLGEEMKNPLNVDFADDGRMFVATTTNGYLHVFNPGATKPSTTLDMPGALYGVQLDTEFAKNGYLYLVRTQNGHNSQRLVRYQIGKDNKLIGAEKVLVGGLTACQSPPVEEDCMSALGAHDTGTIRTDPRDGTIWFGNGDNQDPGYRQAVFAAQDEHSLAGKILHVDREGRGLPNHPYCKGVTDLDRPCTKIWAKGVRNPYRFNWRPDGKLLIGDVGWNTREEATLLDTTRGGVNLGWPCYEGSVRTASFRDDSKCHALYALEGTADAATLPNYEYQHVGDDFAIIGGPAYRGGTYPADFVGDSFIADFGHGWIKRLEFDGAGRLVAEKPFATGANSVVDLELAPNGDLVFVELVGKVWRVRSTSTNRVPEASAGATPTSGDPPLRVTFSSAGSRDPDGDALRFEWDFGDGSATSAAANPVHTYSRPGTFTARLTVRDPDGALDTASVRIDVGNRPPVVELTAPASYRDGQRLLFSATATDPEDGTLPASAFRWESEQVHGTHVHLGDDVSGVRSYAFTTSTDHDSDSHYRIAVTVVDGDGGQTTRTADVHPEVVDFAMTSDPPGVPLVYDGRDVTAPFAQQSAIGLRTTVSAAPAFVRQGRTYEFARWSDGGARNHDITIGDSPMTLHATYEPASGPVDATSVEGEDMTGVTARGAIRRLEDPQASGGAVAYMTKASALSVTRTLPATARLTVWANGRQCAGMPLLVVRAGAAEVLKVRVPAGRISQFSVPVALPAGEHAFRIMLQSDRSGSCRRGLLVDRLVLSPVDAAGDPTDDLLERFEAEDLSGISAMGAARLAEEPGASGGRAVRFVRNGTVRTKRRIAATRYLVLRARGIPCAGDPLILLRRNGTELVRALVPPQGYQDVVLAVDLAAGDYELDLGHVGDKRTSTCDRDLLADSITLFADDGGSGFAAATGWSAMPEGGLAG